MLPIVREHDSGQVEIYFYSDAVDPDFMTGKFRGLADSWRDTASFTHEALAEQIRADQIDILVDLTLHMSGSRLLSFARKPARVQLTYGGYPSSTGLQAMDYRLTDPYLDPPGVGDELYAEQSVRLPDCFWCYVPDGPQPDVSALPSDHVGVITFGCLNNFSKVNDDVLRTWAQVMRHVERSRLLLLAPAGSARQRTLHVLAAQGISPDRVEFTPHQPLASYLKTYDRIDIGLDTFPYNGHTTSLDSFWMGVPVVTLVGRAAVGRAGWSLLSNLGLTELAATHEAQFISTAVELAQDRPRLHRLRHELRSRMLQSPLTDSRRFAGNLESVYRSIWRRWCEKVES
jgi:predicted O-linked N-acetylglucosamine transferase (SPINDLY family)